ncbi:hypothetical protein COJ85_23475 [Bacillus sp. AFS076308]|uniref:hypothetical protein n=1 Tax=unclassified Bacillus (in: firmicutes) TaxID=185979 RepID=UPI000BF2A74C|nr:MULTISPECIES: hypothetical protein [unclassified Bacillus (in: firmicutes)]PFN97315.1 hypothetical protein COJ85_23475 [Bacillus sp. AFS076308]PGV51745.1 hypothetical protein COD92_12920 [Bacillus sp. AFS037270]
MKRIILLILTALILAACTPKAYTESMDAGKAALEKGDYVQAINKLENAIEEKDTQDAQNYLHIAKTLVDSQQLYHDGEFDTAIDSIQKLLKDKAMKNSSAKIEKQANTLLAEVKRAKTVSETMKEQMVKGKTLFEGGQYDQAAEVFKGITETTDLPEVSDLELMSKDASELLTEATKKETALVQEKQAQQEEAKQKETEEKQKQAEASKPLTSEQAVQLVKEHLKIKSNQNVKIVYYHDAENGDYIIKVYEFVIDNPSTGEGHTATWGWYGVNKQTKTVYDAMN